MASSAQSTINGETDVILIVGQPVAQVQAPALFNAVFARAGLNAVMVPVSVSPADLSRFVEAAFLAPNIRGLSATIPHKSALMEIVDVCGAAASRAGAVNAVRREANGQLTGELFDGFGLRAALDHFGMAYAGRRVLLLGAGGAAAAIASALVQAPGAAGQVQLYDPAPGKSAELAQRLAQANVQVAASNDPSGFDLVINASPSGLKPTDAMPCAIERLEPHAAVMDIVMKNQPSPWVRAARARGLQAQPGFEMLVQQTAPYLDFFGYPEAARMVRDNADFLRQTIYPAALHDEIASLRPHTLIPALL